MMEYKFEKIQVKGLPGMYTKPQADYREVINDYAKQGWKLVQVLSLPNSIYGGSSYIEIIFSKEVEDYTN